MRLSTWWLLWPALFAAALAQKPELTICDENFCRCDSFTKVICNCTRDHELTLRPAGVYRVPHMTNAIIVNGCKSVIFLQDTVKDLLQLRSIEITNVNNVVISERALAWSPFSIESESQPGLRIAIENSTVNEISSHAITGRVNDIIITNSRLNKVKPFAFSSLIAVRNIELTNNELQNIDTQAFKKFTTVNFLLRGGTANILPSRFLSDVEVTNLLRMDSVTVNHINSLAFLVSSPKRVLVENNNIGNLEADAFHVVTRGPITLRNNTIMNMRKGAILGFTVDREITSVKGRLELLVDNNTISNITPSSLMFNRTTLTLRVDGMNLNKTCSCELADEWKEQLQEQGGILTCWYDLEGHFMSLPTYVESRCGTFKNTFWIFVVTGVVVVLITALLVTIFIVKHEQKKKKKVQIVMPDGKTYRETEFHIVVERAELLTTNF